MTARERWDVALKVLNGPLRGQDAQVFRGPVIRIGANPGPGGFQLTGYRGLDARQCVITAYDGGSVAVAPVGSNQVRLAPHPNVNWRDIDPIHGPEYLSKGCALHLGPVGRGATLEFVETRKLGMWQQGRLASEVADVPTEEATRQPASGPVPVAYDARKVGTVNTSVAPIWFLGCLTVMATFTATAIVLIGASVTILNRNTTQLGPSEEGYEFYESVDMSDPHVDMSLYEGLQKPFYAFVMSHNAEAAGSAQRDLDNPDHWDARFLTAVTASVEKHVRSRSVFRRLDAVRNEYAEVVTALRAAGLPEVLAAIPYTESRYRAGETSNLCAKGFWQFMPETALRASRLGGVEFRVQGCRIRGTNVRWQPTKLAPPPNKRLEYVDEEMQCKIESCDVDDRTNLARSTQAAIYTLGEAYKDPVLRASGSVVQATILSHHSGYDDSRFGSKKRSNMLFVVKDWVARNGQDQGPHFYGQNITCPRHDTPGTCGSRIAASTQHYAYNIVAQHFLAVCYYARNYGENQAFRPWTTHIGEKGYCNQFRIPPRQQMQGGSTP